MKQHSFSTPSIGFARHNKTNDLTVSPVTLTHVLALDALPFHHKDPFDRLLIAQSIEEKLTIVTADSQFSAYSVKLLQ
ncbi:MAG TPA: type II toxin-antitoxin system VapC family toxin [Pyrinomonadaceae bacterium]|nr:type II toxin-antitoxin system VapC family toxin [Pyrinomonadaceae bacterium]